MPPLRRSSHRRGLLLRNGNPGQVRTSFVSGILLLTICALQRPVLQSDYPALEKLSDKVVKEKQKFERLVVPKEKLLEMFAVSVGYLPCGAMPKINVNAPFQHSITSTRSTLLRARFPMVLPRLSIGRMVPSWRRGSL